MASDNMKDNFLYLALVANSWAALVHQTMLNRIRPRGDNNNPGGFDSRRRPHCTNTARKPVY